MRHSVRVFDSDKKHPVGYFSEAGTITANIVARRKFTTFDEANKARLRASAMVKAGQIVRVVDEPDES